MVSSCSTFLLIAMFLNLGVMLTFSPRQPRQPKIRLVSQFLSYKQDGVEFSWRIDPPVNRANDNEYKCEVIECNAGSFRSIEPMQTTNQTKCQFRSDVFNLVIDDKNKFIRIDDIDEMALYPKLEFRFEDEVSVVQVNKGGKYCLSTNISIRSHESLQSLWAVTPESKEDCICFIPRNLNLPYECTCVMERSAEFAVNYNRSTEQICWENLNLVKPLKVFLFTEVDDLCSANKSSVSRTFYAGTEISNRSTGHSSFGIQILLCFCIVIVKLL